MGWLSMGTPNPSPSTAGCLVLPEQGRIHPLGYQRAEPQNAAKKRMLGGNHLPERPPQPPALGHHLAPGAPTSPLPYGGALDPTPLPTPHICTHTPPYFPPTPYKTRQPSHQEHPEPPAPPQNPPARPCPSSPALRQPCLFAQGICSRGHLL